MNKKIKLVLSILYVLSILTIFNTLKCNTIIVLSANYECIQPSHDEDLPTI